MAKPNAPAGRRSPATPTTTSRSHARRKRG